jgi:hypothetical protein
MILCQFYGDWLNSVKCCFLLKKCWLKADFRHLLAHKKVPML